MDVERVADLFTELDERERATVRRSLVISWHELFAARAARARARLAELNYYQARRFVCVILLRAIRDARRGRKTAWEWIQSEHATHLAQVVDLHQWPPTRAQVERARVPKAYTE